MTSRHSFTQLPRSFAPEFLFPVSACRYRRECLSARVPSGGGVCRCGHLHLRRHFRGCYRRGGSSPAGEKSRAGGFQQSPRRHDLGRAGVDGSRFVSRRHSGHGTGVLHSGGPEIRWDEREVHVRAKGRRAGLQRDDSGSRRAGLFQSASGRRDHERETVDRHHDGERQRFPGRDVHRLHLRGRPDGAGGRDRYHRSRAELTIRRDDQRHSGRVVGEEPVAGWHRSLRGPG